MRIQLSTSMTTNLVLLSRPSKGSLIDCLVLGPVRQTVKKWRPDVADSAFKDRRSHRNPLIGHDRNAPCRAPQGRNCVLPRDCNDPHEIIRAIRPKRVVAEAGHQVAVS